MKYIKTNIVVAFLVVTITADAQTRLIEKLKDKAEDKLIEQIFNEGDKSPEDNQNNQDLNNSNTSGNRNTKGEGLSQASIDVIDNINEASSAYNSGKYNDARFAVRQAIQGIEIEMGKLVLNSFPESIGGLNADKENDQVTTTGIGFVGMVMERGYLNNDQELKVVVANNSIWISSVNMYLNNTAYASQNGDEQYKQVKFQDYRGVIEFDESSGYKLSVPFGQSSILVVSGINFDNEQKFMAACNEINLRKIISLLGEK